MPVLAEFDAVVDALGGTNAVAVLCGVTASVVCKWRTRYGAFPAAKYQVIKRALAREGFTIPDDLFRFGRGPERRRPTTAQPEESHG